MAIKLPDWVGWTIQEASEETGYNPEHLRRLIRQGKIDGAKVGTFWLVRMDSLRDYLKKAEAEGKNNSCFGPKFRNK